MKKTEKPSRQLKLARDVLRNLTQAELPKVSGGWRQTMSAGCGSYGDGDNTCGTVVGG